MERRPKRCFSRFLRNKYFVGLVLFLLWMTFFDRNDLLSLFGLRLKLARMEQDKQYYTEEITRNRQELKGLLTDPTTLEKFAREKYLMKKDDEELFVIVPEE